MEKFYSRNQLAVLMNTTPDLIRKQLEPDGLKASKDGRKVIYLADDVIRFLVERDRAGTSEDPDYRHELTRLTKIKADRQELELAVERRQFLSLASVAEFYRENIFDMVDWFNSDMLDSVLRHVPQITPQQEFRLREAISKTANGFCIADKHAAEKYFLGDPEIEK